MKRSHKKKVTTESKPEAEIPAAAEPVPSVPPDDGEAKTAAEQVPTGRKRGPYKPRAKKAALGGTVGPEGKLQLSPQLAKVAALAPMMLASGIGSRFFGVLLPYDPATIHDAQFQFEAWMQDLGLSLGPGWQYGALCCVAIAQGISDAEPITKEMREAMLAHKAKLKADRKAAREAKEPEAPKPEQKNGAAPPPAVKIVPQDPGETPEASA